MNYEINRRKVEQKMWLWCKVCNYNGIPHWGCSYEAKEKVHPYLLHN